MKAGGNRGGVYWDVKCGTGRAKGNLQTCDFGKCGGDCDSAFMINLT